MLVVGLSGATCSGKTTISNILQRIFTNSRVFNQDDYYYSEDSPNHTKDENGEFINWEILSAFDMSKLKDDLTREINVTTAVEPKPFPIQQKLSVEDIFKIDKRSITNFAEATHNPDEVLDLKLNTTLFKDVRLILVEGILVLNDARIASACEHKFFVDLDYETCWSRRQHRTYDPQDQPGYFNNVVWPFFQSNLAELKASGQPITFLRGEHEIQENVCKILNHLIEHQNKPQR